MRLGDTKLEPVLSPMNIIIVRNAHSVPRRFDLAGRRERLLALAALAGCAMFFVAIGAASALLLGSTRAHDLREMALGGSTLPAAPGGDIPPERG